MLADAMKTLDDLLTEVPQDDLELEKMWNMLKPLTIKSLEDYLGRVSTDFDVLDLA